MCCRTVDAYVLASAPSRQARSPTSRPAGSRIRTRHPVGASSMRTSYPLSPATRLPPPHHVPLEPVQGGPQGAEDRLAIQREGGCEIGQRVHRELQRAPGGLRVAEGIDEGHGVVGIERLAVPRTLAARGDHLLREELPTVAAA